VSEAKIKSAVLAHVRRTGARRKRPVVTTEFSLGSSSARADLAIFSEDFVGVEIKSPSDSLRRLPHQLDSYVKYFDRVVLVAAPSHLKGLAGLDTRGASVWTFDERFNLREVEPSEHRNEVEDHAYLDLLTQQERRWLASNLDGSDTASSKLTTEARLSFSRIFEARYGRTSAEFWAATARRSIQESDLIRLSRFAPVREKYRQHESAKAEFWASWVRQTTAILAT
jgi:hypothetical protein